VDPVRGGNAADRVRAMATPAKMATPVIMPKETINKTTYCWRGPTGSTVFFSLSNVQTSSCKGCGRSESVRHSPRLGVADFPHQIGHRCLGIPEEHE
jgi:hypothetical protein